MCRPARLASRFQDYLDEIGTWFKYRLTLRPPVNMQRLWFKQMWDKPLDLSLLPRDIFPSRIKLCSGLPQFFFFFFFFFFLERQFLIFRETANLTAAYGTKGPKSLYVTSRYKALSFWNWWKNLEPEGLYVKRLVTIRCRGSCHSLWVGFLVYAFLRIHFFIFQV